MLEANFTGAAAPTGGDRAPPSWGPRAEFPVKTKESKEVREEVHRNKIYKIRRKREVSNLVFWLSKGLRV